VLSASLLLLLQGCTRREPRPQVAFERIRLAFLRGELDRARAESDRASKQFSGHDEEWAWRFRLLEAEILANQGLSQDVVNLLSPQLPQFLAHGELAVRQHMLLALANSHLGHSSQADENLLQAEQICTASNCAVMGEVARIAGAIEAERDHAEKAESFFRQSLQIARERGDKFLECSDLLNLGVVAIGNEHFDESVDWSNAATDLAQAVRAGLTEEKALGNLGWAYYKMGDYEKSLDFFVAAGKRSQELGAVIDEVEWLNDQGLVYFQTGQFETAEKYYRQSLELARGSGNKVQTIQALTALGFLSVQTAQLAEARQFSDEALRLAREEADRPDELYALLIQAQIAGASKDTKRAEELLLEVAGDPGSDTSLRWEAHEDLAGLYEAEGQPARAEEQFRQSIAIVEAARGSLRHEEFRLPFLANAAHLYDEYVRSLVARGQPLRALQVADYSRAQTLLEGLGARAKRPAPGSSPQLQAQPAAKAAGGTILFYWLGRAESYLWAITPRSTRVLRLPARAEIEARVQAYRRVLTGPRDPLQTNNSDGHALYDVLVAPAAKLIAPHSRVLVIPDGTLNNLNFETLLVSRPRPHYWIEDVTVMNANSISLLAESRSRSRPSTEKLLLIGAANTPDRQYPELTNADAEMKAIQSHFPAASTQVFAREKATTAAYWASKPEQFSVIHFVAHGSASQLSPLDSAILLSNSADGSFKLYARDIIRRPLGAELVTISSCYGEGTRAYTGEGLVGLSWAFLRAGAHNVIGALWEVSDTSTPQLMDRFYGELEQGKSPEAALREAKLEMIHSDGVFRKPFYWAPFQLYVGL